MKLFEYIDFMQQPYDIFIQTAHTLRCTGTITVKFCISSAALSELSAIDVPLKSKIWFHKVVSS